MSPACQSCGAAVLWKVTTDGRRVPVDPSPAPLGVVRVTRGHAQFLSKDAAAAARAEGEHLYLPHHSSCPSVERHRGIPRSQESLF